VKEYQQGDVILRKVKLIPRNAVVKRGLLVQEGESTGHVHRFSDKHVSLWEFEGKTFVSVKKKPAPLTHDEHEPIKVPPGSYEIDLVREYDYDKHEVRHVID
jgi:hypothetical protein